MREAEFNPAPALPRGDRPDLYSILRRGSSAGPFFFCVLVSIAPKSVTPAVSMEIARDIGGFPAITACLTIFTGIAGAVLGPYILTWGGVSSLVPAIISAMHVLEL